jgi:hypothetical protein
MLMKWCYKVINFLLRIIKNGILMNFNVKEEYVQRANEGTN